MIEYLPSATKMRCGSNAINGKHASPAGTIQRLGRVLALINTTHPYTTPPMIAAYSSKPIGLPNTHVPSNLRRPTPRGSKPVKKPSKRSR